MGIRGRFVSALGGGQRRRGESTGGSELTLQRVDVLLELAKVAGGAVDQRVDLVHAVSAEHDVEPGLVQFVGAERVVGQRFGHPVRLRFGEPGLATERERDDTEDDACDHKRRHDEEKEICHGGIVSRWSRHDERRNQVTLRLGARMFADTDLLVMAIVNRTPDSFFDRGATFADDAAMAAVDRAVAEGADIVDVGGVKAGPGADVDPDEERRRTVPFVAAIRRRHPDLIISIDTWRAAVARDAIAAGADLINDTWAGADPGLVAVAAETGAALVCSHTGGHTPRTRPHRVAYDDVTADVIATVTRLADEAVAAGVRRDGILVDPTHDFGKNTWHSLELTRRLDELAATGWPVLVALSNKDFIGEALDLPVSDRLEGTLAATAVSAWLGARVFRAHQVRATRRVLDMVATIRGSRPPAVARRGLT